MTTTTAKTHKNDHQKNKTAKQQQQTNNSMTPSSWCHLSCHHEQNFIQGTRNKQTNKQTNKISLFFWLWMDLLVHKTKQSN